MLFLDYLRNQPIYHQLTQVHNTNEGNLLEITDQRTAEAQIEFMRWAIRQVKGSNFLEIGTNKGLWGFLLSHIRNIAYLTTVDVNPDSERAAEILKASTLNQVLFINGSSIEVLPTLTPGDYDFLWLDGNHNYDYTLQDLRNAVDLRIPFIAIDDTNMGSVQQAINDWLQTTQIVYHEVVNPFIQYDSRKVRLYKRVI